MDAAARIAGDPIAADAAAVFAAFARWRFWDDREGGGPEARLARDGALGEAVARGASPPTLRLWENPRALVVSRRERRLPGFEEASRRLAREGWPVLIRDSGGGAVPHGEGILQLTLALPRREVPVFSIETLYRALCAPLILALDGLGVETAFGAAPGGFCDGRFNLVHRGRVHRGRKLAGTAQRWRGAPAGATRGYALGHALLVVDCDLAAANRALNRFYELAGSDQRIDPRASTTVRICLDASRNPVGPAPGQSPTDAMRARIAAAVRLCLGRRA
ncbi:MAG: biotin/lipoate A/B protein ligase family protein, partial [Alphaproteobacteria bacterium]